MRVSTAAAAACATIGLLSNSCSFGRSIGLDNPAPLWQHSSRSVDRPTDRGSELSWQGGRWPCRPRTAAVTTSSSWADESPDRPRPCCWPVSGMTWWSWTRRPSRATPCPRTRSRAAASSSSAAGACSTRSSTVALRPSGRSRSMPVVSRSAGRSRTRPGSTSWSRLGGTCWTRSSRPPRNTPAPRCAPASP